MTSQRVPKPSLRSPSRQEKSSPFAPRPFAAQQKKIQRQANDIPSGQQGGQQPAEGPRSRSNVEICSSAASGVVQRIPSPLTEGDIGGTYVIQLGDNANPIRARFNGLDHRGIHQFTDTTGINVAVHHRGIHGKYIYREGQTLWAFDEEAGELKKNGVTLISNVQDWDDALDWLVTRFREMSEVDSYPEADGDENLEGDFEAQMLDEDGDGNFLEEDGIVFDGAAVTANITDGESVSSSGASTCVIVILVATVQGVKRAVCRHFTAGTDHFENPTQYLNEMVADLGNPNPANVQVFAVGGVEGGNYYDPGEYFALAQALDGYDVEVFNVPAFDEDDNPEDIESVEASYSAAGFKWRFARGD